MAIVPDQPISSAMAKQNNTPPAAPAATADTQTEQAAAAPAATADTQTEQAAAAPAAAVSNVIEMNIHRVEEHPEGGLWAFGRAVNQPDASNVMANESWGGKSPRGFMEIVVTDGELMGLQAGHRVRLTVEQVQ